jgi:hypothetical protein
MRLRIKYEYDHASAKYEYESTYEYHPASVKYEYDPASVKYEDRTRGHTSVSGMGGGGCRKRIGSQLTQAKINRSRVD